MMLTESWRIKGLERGGCGGLGVEGVRVIVISWLARSGVLAGVVSVWRDNCVGVAAGCEAGAVSSRGSCSLNVVALAA